MSDDHSHEEHRSTVSVTCTPRPAVLRSDILQSQLLANLSQFGANPALAALLGIRPLRVFPFQVSPFQVSPFQVSPFQVSPFQVSPFQASPFVSPLGGLSPFGTGLSPFVSPLTNVGTSVLNPFNRICF